MSGRFAAAMVGGAMLCALAAPAAAQDTHLLVIAGVPGSPDYATKFQTWSVAVVDAAERLGVATANITFLADKPEADPRIDGRGTRENVSKAVADIAGRAAPDDEVFVVLIGHGSFDGRTAAFNLPGPDLTADDYATLLGQLSRQRVVFINTASSSGGFLAPLAGPGRTVVTATRTGGERNDTRFPEFFIEALTGDVADADRNGRVSIAEMFEYARTKVAASYEQTGHVPTEHPSLDDSADGTLASVQFLAPPRSRSAEMATASPALRAAVEARDGLEQKVAGLRLRKDSMDAEQYERELEALLTELALKTREIRDLEAQGR